MESDRENRDGPQERRASGSKTRDPCTADCLLVLPGVHQGHQVYRPKQIDDHRVLERRQGKQEIVL